MFVTNFVQNALIDFYDIVVTFGRSEIGRKINDE